MTYETYKRCKLAFIRHRQVPRGKLVRAPPPVRHTDKARPCMRDTLSDFCAEHTISTTSQPKKSLLSALPSVHTASMTKKLCSTGLSAGLSLSCPSQLSIKSNDTICKAVADPNIHMGVITTNEAIPVYSGHSDCMPAEKTHSVGQSGGAKVTEVEATDIESCNLKILIFAFRSFFFIHFSYIVLILTQIIYPFKMWCPR